MNRGAEQYEKATDVLSLIRVQHRLKILESLFFDKGQLAMLGLHRWRYLKTASSDTQEELVRAPDSESSFEETSKSVIKSLHGYTFDNEMDKKLWEHCVLGPKDKKITSPSGKSSSLDG